MSNLDLQEATRRDDTYVTLNKLIDGLQELNVFPSLVWLWTWDVTKAKLESYGPESGDDYLINPRFTEKDVFDMFWEDADKNAFTLEYGTESLDEAIFDWMLDRNIIISVDDGEWEDDD
jgi:hypothetical protein